VNKGMEITCRGSQILSREEPKKVVISWRMKKVGNMFNERSWWETKTSGSRKLVKKVRHRGRKLTVTESKDFIVELCSELWEVAKAERGTSVMYD